MKKDWFVVDPEQIDNSDYISSVSHPAKSARLAFFSEFDSDLSPVQMNVCYVKRWSDLYKHFSIKLFGQACKFRGEPNTLFFVSYYNNDYNNCRHNVC